MADDIKPPYWIGSAKKDLKAFPLPVKRVMTFAILEAQKGRKHPDTKPFKGFGGSGVLEVVDDYDGDTYRAVYTVNFQDVVFVLHCFQKKSKQGIKTPQQDIELIHERYKRAEQLYQSGEWRNGI